MQRPFAFFLVAGSVVGGSVGALGCGSGDDDSGADTFDPTGVFEGPSTVAELESGKSFTAPADGAITLNMASLALGPTCTLALVSRDSVAFRADTSGASDIKVLALVQAPTNGQMCTLQTAAGTVNFTVTDGLVTVWRANSNATIEVAVSGTTSASGTVVYNFTGYR